MIDSIRKERILAARRWGWELWFASSAAIAALLLQGCAALPVSMQPTDPGSRAAEGLWDVVDTVDTIQTVQFLRSGRCSEVDPAAKVIYGGGKPSATRVVLTNTLLLSIHSYVSRWIDDHVAESESKDDGNVGAWYVGRIAWHALSIGYSVAAISTTRSNGCL